MITLDEALNAAWWNANFLWHGLGPAYDIYWSDYTKEFQITPHVQIIVWPWTRL